MLSVVSCTALGSLDATTEAPNGGLLCYIVADRMRTARHLFRTAGLQHALIAFLHTLAARSRSRFRRSLSEGRKPTLEAGRLKLLAAILAPRATMAVTAVTSCRVTGHTPAPDRGGVETLEKRSGRWMVPGRVLAIYEYQEARQESPTRFVGVVRHVVAKEV